MVVVGASSKKGKWTKLKVTTTKHDIILPAIALEVEVERILLGYIENLKYANHDIWDL